MTDLTSRLSKCYASAIHDVLREKGYGNCVLPPEIQALEREKRDFASRRRLPITADLYGIDLRLSQLLARQP